MKPKVKERATAIKMRRRGATYGEIMRTLKISKGSCSLWLRSVKIDTKARDRIQTLRQLAREKAWMVLGKKREDRDNTIRGEVDKVFRRANLDRDVQKLLCAALHWAEGHKRTSMVSFTNSDPNMISTYLSLLRSGFSIKEEKLYAWLHLHEYHDVNKQKQFWSKVTGIPVERINIYMKPNSGKNVREGYPGCICVRYGDVRLAKEIEFLYTALIKKFGGVV